MANQRLCSIEGCGKSHAAKGYCFEHRYRMNRYGDPLFKPPVNQGKRHKYLREVVLKNDGNDCLFWPFAAPSHGYPLITFDGAQIGVHRLVCQMVHGEPPHIKMHAAHSCGNGHRGCVNHRHLSWKTAKGNSDDKITHGTLTRGERATVSKLTEADVLEIRRIGRGMTQMQLASKFNVDRSTIGYVLRRTIWTHLEP